MLNISKENKIFGLIEILINAVNAIFFAYIAIYLKDIGYSESSIGIIMSTTLAVNILAQPVIGYLSDNYIGIKRIIVFCVTVMLLSVSVIPFVKQYYYVMLIVFTIISFSGRPTASVMDMYVTMLSKIRSGLDFGFVRGLGSLGYALTAVIAGLIIKRFGSGSIFIMHAITSILAVFAITKAEDVPVRKIKGSQKTAGFVSVMKQLLGIRAYVVAIIAVSIVFLAANAHGTYMSIIILGLGGTPADFGAAVFLSAASEAPVMWNYYRLLKYISAESMLCVSLAFYTVRMLIMLLFPNLMVMIIMQLMQSVSFGLFIPSFIRHLQAIAPDSVGTTAVLLGAAIYGGVSGVAGTVLGGILLENKGHTGFYLFCFVCCLTGFIIFGLSSLISYIQRKRSIT